MRFYAYMNAIIHSLKLNTNKLKHTHIKQHTQLRKKNTRMKLVNRKTELLDNTWHHNLVCSSLQHFLFLFLITDVSQPTCLSSIKLLRFFILSPSLSLSLSHTPTHFFFLFFIFFFMGSGRGFVFTCTERDQNGRLLFHSCRSKRSVASLKT
jgi:hypothetical protein